MIRRPQCVLALTGALLVSVAASAQPTPAPLAEPEVARVASMGETPTPAVAPAAPGRRIDRTYNFQLVLLLADNVTPAVTENVPLKAQKALKDLQDFLPYKSYHLVDMAWLRTSREASSQITGPKGETYLVELVLSPFAAPGERLVVQEFQITEVAVMPPGALLLPNGATSPGAVPGSSSSPRAARRLLSSTFGMELGETVVVGTAKMDGPGKALIVLLSALP